MQVYIGVVQAVARAMIFGVDFFHAIRSNNYSEFLFNSTKYFREFMIIFREGL
jgi:hypothetical protein